jgi:hypothetical protein
LGIVATSTRARAAHAVLLAVALVAPACTSGPLARRQFEYEEEIYLNVDGTATLNINASVAALVALRGAVLPTDPAARVDRDALRAFLSGPGTRVTRVSLGRRNGRRFVYASLDVDDIRKLSVSPVFAWSRYAMDRQGDVFEFRQTVGRPTGQAPTGVDWRGDELVRFRVHVPSEIPFHNAPLGVERGNILSWEQSLAARMNGEQLDMQFQMEPASILYTTLLLFGGTILAAALAFAVAIWLFVKKGRRAEAIESGPS